MDLVVKNVSKAYGDKRVLENVNVSFAPGNIYALMGPSGRGKTTLLRLILGLERQDSGEITGVPERSAVVFQESRLCKELTIPGNLRLVLGRRFPKADMERVLAALHLTDCLDIPAEKLSGGQARRAALARALLYRGDLLVLDEPFTGLDERNRESALETIRRFRGNATVLLVTHSREDAEKLGAEIVEL